MTPQDKKNQQAACGCLGCTGIIVIFVIWVVITTSSGTTVSNSPTKTEAWVYSQPFIQNHLTAPASAEWPWYDPTAVTQTGNRFSIRAYVDSQNIFGAMLRTQYQCTVEYIPATKTWRLIDLNFLD